MCCLVSFETLDEQTKDIMESIKNMEDLANQVVDPHLRARMDAQIGELKGDVADLRPYDVDLQSFIIDDNRYTTALSADELDALEPSEATKWLSVREEIVETANSCGLDGDKFVARFNDHETLTLGTTMAWRGEDITAANAHFESQGIADSHERAESVISELHQIASSKVAEVVQDILHTLEETAHAREQATHTLDQNSHGIDDDGHDL